MYGVPRPKRLRIDTMPRTSLRLREEDINRLEALQDALGLSTRSEVIRYAVTQTHSEEVEDS